MWVRRLWTRLGNERGAVGSDPTDATVDGADEDPESAASQKGGVKVDLKETPPAKDAAKGTDRGSGEVHEASADAERRWKAVENQLAATRRINEELKRQVQTLSERLERPATGPAPDDGAKVLPKGTEQAIVDQYDKLVAEGKWQDAVRILSREEYKSSRAVELAEERVRLSEERRLATLERSKQSVEAVYPALSRTAGNPEAMESVLFNQAVAELSNEDDQFLRDPYAPELAMHRMEKLAREQGIALTKASVPANPTGRSSSRGGQTSMPASRGSGGATTYTLTREQKEWCDSNLSHLPESERYKHYARFAKMAEAGGVEA